MEGLTRKLLPNMALDKPTRLVAQNRAKWLISHAKDIAEANQLLRIYNEESLAAYEKVVAYAEEHSSYDDEHGLPSTPPCVQDNAKKQQTVDEKLEKSVREAKDLFKSNGLTALQATRVCKRLADEYHSDHRVAFYKKRK